MFYVVCPLCHIGIEIPATAASPDAGPDCTDLQNVAGCQDCGESFFFDAREVIEEAQPEQFV